MKAPKPPLLLIWRLRTLLREGEWSGLRQADGSHVFLVIEDDAYWRVQVTQWPRVTGSVLKTRRVHQRYRHAAHEKAREWRRVAGHAASRGLPRRYKVWAEAWRVDPIEPGSLEVLALLDHVVEVPPFHDGPARLWQ